MNSLSLFDRYRIGTLPLKKPHRHGSHDPGARPAARKYPLRADGEILPPARQRRIDRHGGDANLS
ncbi:hypothetical protein BN1200_1050035 [Klebsiella variicola]|nr:hypothetical protein BN1200_1050035 [Klebsiella variicola]